MVIELTTLNVVANDVSTDGSTVPADISQYLKQPARYFLYAISNAAWASVMPQGNLYTLLQNAGSGAVSPVSSRSMLRHQLRALRRSATSSQRPWPMTTRTGFETLSMTDLTILTMAFLPVTVNGQTIYAPIQQGS